MFVFNHLVTFSARPTLTTVFKITICTLHIPLSSVLLFFPYHLSLPNIQWRAFYLLLISSPWENVSSRRTGPCRAQGTHSVSSEWIKHGQLKWLGRDISKQIPCSFTFSPHALTLVLLKDCSPLAHEGTKCRASHQQIPTLTWAFGNHFKVKAMYQLVILRGWSRRMRRAEGHDG